MAKIDWYLEFVDEDYLPNADDIVALFYFEPGNGISKKEAAGRIASESSTGTWTTLATLPPRMRKLMAKVYELNGNFAKIAYPIELWEEANAPQLLAGLAGNIFGMKAIKNLRLLDAKFPPKYLKSFKGPTKGIQGVRKLMGIKNRPLTGAVPKPKIGFSSLEHSQIAYETWMGGFDLVKDDENLTSVTFNKFEERVALMERMREKAEKATGDKKDALINITAPVEVMEKRAKLLYESGFGFAMIDVVVAGTSAVQYMREILEDYGMAIHAHRAMHASFDRNPKHGISMLFLAKLMRLIGVDQLHAGTGVGKLVGRKDEIKAISDVLREKRVKAVENLLLEQNWGNIKPALPVSSGGLHPGLIPDVIKLFGTDCVILVSGGIHGHPDGTRAGAKAAMDAIYATLDGISLEEASKKSNALAKALQKWGHFKPK